MFNFVLFIIKFEDLLLLSLDIYLSSENLLIQKKTLKQFVLDRKQFQQQFYEMCNQKFKNNQEFKYKYLIKNGYVQSYKFKICILSQTPCIVQIVRQADSMFFDYQRRSNDIRDMQSKSKKSTNKQYKDYAKRLIENDPNRIDNERRLKIDPLSSNLKQLKQKLQRKPGQVQNQMFRSGVVRFIKPKLSQRDYRRFKKFLEIFNKIQKTRHQVMALKSLSSKHIKQAPSLQNQKLRQLEQNWARLRLQQETILLEIQNQGKQNKISRLFSLQTGVNPVQKKIAQLQTFGVKIDSIHHDSLNSEKQSLNKQSPSIHHRTSSQIHKKSVQTEQQRYYLRKLNDFITNLNSTKTVQRKQVYMSNYEQTGCQKLYVEVKDFITSMQKTSNQLISQLHKVNSVNHKDVMECQQKSHSDKPLGNQRSLTNFHKFHDLQQKYKQQNMSSVSNFKPKKSLQTVLKQIQQDLTQFKNTAALKQRNNELAKLLLTTNKQLQKFRQEKQKTSKQRRQEADQLSIVKRQNQLLHNKNQKLEQEIEKLKSGAKYEKYYRQNLSLEQEVRILSEQNEKLIQEMKLIKSSPSRGHEKQQRHEKTQETSRVQQKSQQAHQKSIKQCSGNSLIYKQLQKKNKKLTQENTKLKIQASQLKANLQKVNRQKQNQKQEQLSAENIKRDLIEKNKRLAEQNRKIQEQFQCLVKQKLQIQSLLHIKSANLSCLSASVYDLRQKSAFNLQELQQIVAQLKEDKYFLQAQLQRLKSSLSQMFNCFCEQVSNALLVFIDGYTEENILNTNLILQTQTNDKNESVGQQPEISQVNLRDLMVQNSQVQLNLISQNYEISQNYKILENQFNHCLFELNSFRDMYSQVQIEKQLQKKYFQEDFNRQKLRYSVLQRQRAQLQSLIRTEKAVKQHQSIISVNQYSQTESKSIKRITSNVISLTYPFLECLTYPFLESKLKNSQLVSLKQCKIVSRAINHQYFGQKKPKKLKINCESLSLCISSEVFQSKQATQKYEQIGTQYDKQFLKLDMKVVQFINQNQQTKSSLEKDTFSQLLSFENWIKQTQLEESGQMEDFINFCTINLKPEENDYQKLNSQIQSLIQQKRILKHEIETFTNIKMQRADNKNLQNKPDQPGQQQFVSLKDNLVSQNQDLYELMPPQLNMEGQKLRIMGSLYNEYNFPQLQRNLSLKQCGKLQKDETERIGSKIAYLSNKQKQQNTAAITSVNNASNRLHNEEEDQSFDLCII